MKKGIQTFLRSRRVAVASHRPGPGKGFCSVDTSVAFHGGCSSQRLPHKHLSMKCLQAQRQKNGSPSPVPDYADRCHLADGRSVWLASPSSGRWFPTLGSSYTWIRCSLHELFLGPSQRCVSSPAWGFPILNHGSPRAKPCCTAS